MSQIPIYHGGVRARGLAEVSKGPRATAESFGAGQARDMQNLAGALGNVNNAVPQIGLNKQARREETENRQLFQQANDAWLEQEKDWIENRRGLDAADLDKEAAQWWDDWKAKAETGITSTRQKDAFNRMFEGKRSGAQGAMWRYSVQQVNSASMASRDAENEGFIREAAAHGLMNDPYVEERRQWAHANIRVNLRGYTEDVVQEAVHGFDRKLHLSMIEAAAAQEQGGAGKALEYLNREGVAEVLGAGMTMKLRAQYGKDMIDAAKNQAGNEMRQLGIRLGEQYDNEIDIERALDRIENRELADIAKKYAEARRAARLAAGKDAPRTAEEKAAAERAAREKAAGILAGADPESGVDDITDEDALDVAMDERMARETEVMREKVRKSAVLQMKAKRARLAEARRALDQEALRVMAEAGWDPAAVNPEWPADLQDAMVERAEKRQAAKTRYEEQQEKAAQKARGLELLEMPLDELNRKVLAGEWLDIVDAVGAGTPEMKKLEARIKNADSGGLTILQQAKNRFGEVVGDPKKNTKQFALYMQRVDEARAAEARMLKLDNPDMIPPGRQKEIIDEFLAQGDYGYWGFSPNKYRFQVSDEDLPGWTPFAAPAGARAGVGAAEEFPEAARQYFGPRDRARELLADGSVMITSSNGTVTVINPDGSIEGGQ